MNIGTNAITRDYWLNFIDGRCFLATYARPNASLTTPKDLIECLHRYRNGEAEAENLVCPIEQRYEYHTDLKVATFTGVLFNAELGAELVDDMQAHNVKDTDAGRVIFGLDEDLWVELF